LKSDDKKLSAVPRESEIIIYQSPDGAAKLDVRMQGETLWLTQAQMAELFGRSVSVVSRHIKNIFAEGELAEKSNLQNMQIPNSDKPVVLYSLDVILAVGYRVKSPQGTFGVLEGSGRVGHIEAVEKAHREYNAYRAVLPDNLSDVEKAYLETLRDMQKKLKAGGDGE